MKIRKVIRKELDHDADGVHVAGAVNAVVAADVNESGDSHTRVSSRQRIVQRKGKTTIDQDTEGEVE